MADITFVTVLDKDGTPLKPCSGKRARHLLEKGRAKVVQTKPFIIQLKETKDATKT